MTYFALGAVFGALFMLGSAFWLGIQTAIGNVRWREPIRDSWGRTKEPELLYDGPMTLAFTLLVGAVGFTLVWPIIIALAMGYGVVRLAHRLVRQGDDEASP